MQRLFAIDCDARELSYVMATAVGDRITLEAAATIPVKAPTEDRAVLPDELGKQLQAALSKHKRSGAKFLMVVDRNSIDLSEITVPPSADAELPELVLNQLTMESANIAEESVIDFIAGPGHVAEPRRITAAALARTEFTRVNAVCTAAGFTPDRMLIRPYETASLFLNQRSNGSGNSLLVNVIADEVDLVVVDQARPLFFRTVRLPAAMGDEAAEQRLLDEIRRTLLVAPQNAEVGQVIDSVYIFGTGPEYDHLVQHLSKDGTAKVEILDPYAGFNLSDKWETQSSGRLIPLLGMLTGEARGGKHAIDFLHPRRAPKPPNRKRQLVLALVATLAVGGVGGFYVSDLFSAADRDIKRLREEKAETEALVKKTSEKRKIVDALEDWNGNTVVWLDELRELSAKFPPGKDILIQRLAMNPARNGKASISFLGLAREAKVVPRMESSLRDERHEIQTPRVEERVQDKAYSWSFESAISLSPAKQELEDLTVQDEGPADSVSKKKKSMPPSDKPKKASKSRVNSKKKSATEESKGKEDNSKQENPNTDEGSEMEPPKDIAPAE